MALELRELHCAFGSQRVLAGLSLRLEAGELCGLLGPNGSGKTTALRIALGLLRPDSGSVLVDGWDAARAPRAARRLVAGLVDGLGFEPGLSGLAQLVAWQRLAGVEALAARVRGLELLELVGLASAGARAASDYSQGMRQRLALAQALLGEPRYVLVDEPFNALDPEGVSAFRELLLRLVRERRIGVLLSSHRLEEASELCTRIALVRDGRLAIDAPTSELLASPERRYRLRAAPRERLDAWLVSHDWDVGPGAEREAGARSVALHARAPAELARSLVEAGFALEELRPEQRTLESIYLAAVRGAPREPEAVASETRAKATPSAAASPEPARTEAGAVHARELAHACGYELRRLVRSPASWAVAFAPLALAALALLRRAAQARHDAQQLEAGEVFSATQLTAFEGLAIALQSGLPALALLLAALASQSIAGPRSHGSLIGLGLRPLARAELALGKLFGQLLWALAVYVALALLALGVSGALWDYTGVVELLPNGEPYPLVAASELWPLAYAALAAPIAPLAAALALGFAAGAVRRSSSGALAMSLALLCGCAWLGSALERGLPRALLLTDYLPSLMYDPSLVAELAQAARGASGGHEVSSAWSALIPLAWLVLATAIACLRFQRHPIP
jgi:ABC-type multidrug transport system ATPase subunit